MHMLTFFSFATLKNLNDDRDINTAWKIEISRNHL